SDAAIADGAARRCAAARHDPASARTKHRRTASRCRPARRRTCADPRSGDDAARATMRPVGWISNPSGLAVGARSGDRAPLTTAVGARSPDRAPLTTEGLHWALETFGR